MQKALMQMTLQSHHVVSDSTGATGMRIIRDIIAGERRPEALAAHRDIRCKEPASTLIAALTGNYRDEHVFVLKQAVALYDVYQEHIIECDREIEKAVSRLTYERGS